jgi:hypothetical protein
LDFEVACDLKIEQVANPPQATKFVLEKPAKSGLFR